MYGPLLQDLYYSSPPKKKKGYGEYRPLWPCIMGHLALHSAVFHSAGMPFSRTSFDHQLGHD